MASMKGHIKHAGRILKRARESRAMTQAELARRMGRPPSFIAKGEQNASMTTWRFQDTLGTLGYEIKIVKVKERLDSEETYETTKPGGTEPADITEPEGDAENVQE